ncbi:hypothetical protein NQ314_021347 [Rhamnusium bicolor]|uniref:THAP-type domain-containing protein n=1 Tax=Rhamnusium bicolor TaxID=1586634 RepID=A0AAV8WID4_9CUCU|nr:hypothetical protein NQ314_021347 [Rhamnusium bicolor]
MRLIDINMPICAVVSCKNWYTAKYRVSPVEISYHSFPKLEIVRAEWIKCSGRTGEWNVKNARMCSVHFKDNDFIKDLKEKLLGAY